MLSIVWLDEGNTIHSLPCCFVLSTVVSVVRYSLWYILECISHEIRGNLVIKDHSYNWKRNHIISTRMRVNI